MEEAWGNPSSMHAAGQRARRALDRARDQISGVLGCRAGELIFTSGGTEADNLAIRGVVARHGAERGRHVVTSSVEHEAVLATCRDLAQSGLIELTVVDCDRCGMVYPHDVANAVRDDTVLVSVMYVNNETGIINDIAAIAKLVKEKNPRTLVHTDAVQALGRVDVRVSDLGVDLMSVSGHKVYGPKGIGALWHKQNVAVRGQMSGGGQERGLRSGTENVLGIVGFGVAAERASTRLEAEMDRQGKLANYLRQRLAEEIPEVWLADPGLTVANIVTAAIPDVFTETTVTALDREGICVSGGSACSSGATEPSHVLKAMGVEPRYRNGPVRMSLGEETSKEDIDQVVAALATLRGQSRELVGKGAIPVRTA
jgi:cysteine desulfurase